MGKTLILIVLKAHVCGLNKKSPIQMSPSPFTECHGSNSQFILAEIAAMYLLSKQYFLAYISHLYDPNMITCP